MCQILIEADSLPIIFPISQFPQVLKFYGFRLIFNTASATIRHAPIGANYVCGGFPPLRVISLNLLITSHSLYPPIQTEYFS